MTASPSQDLHRARRSDRTQSRPPLPAASPRRRALAAAALTLAALAGAGCASQRSDRSGLFEPYRTDLPQGNYVTREMLDRVQPGMTPAQVRSALGSPLLESLFRSDRWDYVFRYKHASGRTEQRRVTIRFADGKVAAIEADELPQREHADDPALPGSRAPASR